MIQTRKADIEDIESLAVLFDQYRIFYNQESDISSAKTFFLERMQKEESVIFIALLYGVPIGFTQLYPLFSSVSMQRTWLLNDLYVDKRARKMGAGTKLLDTARQHGIETGAKWLMLQTSKDNITAQSVYENNGWKKIEDFFYEMPLTRTIK